MSDWRVRPAGDSACVLQFEQAIHPDINAAAIAAAEAIRDRALRGVRDVLSTYCSVAVHVDAEIGDPADVVRALEAAASARASSARGRLIEVPVAYGGEYGPDLDDVAAFAGVPAADAIARHAEREYRVFMLGFLPGFAYMGVVDDRIAVPRHATPRLRVPAGSVGIAGPQTGIYPLESPGGWQIVGRTDLQVFDPSQPRPALFAPGDRVKFVPSGIASVSKSPATAESARESGPSDAPGGVTVLRPGLFTTVQDAGRWGYQGLGVPVSGAMDALSHRTANALVGNRRDAATLEVTLSGPELRVETALTLAVSGADLGATLDGRALPMHAPVSCTGGSVLRFGSRQHGGRAYVAFEGGIVTPPVLGSRATHVRTRMGGLHGRPLRAGDRIPIGSGAIGAAGAGRVPFEGTAGPPWERLREGGAVLRVLPGPQDDFFPPGALEILQATRFTVTPQSDRMGYRLSGDRPIPRLPGLEMISDSTYPGAIQVPPSGAPILLMSDRQTTGGYPQIAVVITADLPAAGQLVPGDWAAFRVCSRAEAREALGVLRERLRAGE